MRQNQRFPAQLKSKRCDTFESLWGDFSENLSKMCPQTAGVQSVHLATFWDFVDTFCLKFEHFVSFSEMRRHSLTGLSQSNNSNSAGKLWSWRIQQRVKRRRLTFWSWSHHVWKSRVDKIKCFFSTFCWFQTQFLINLDISKPARSAALGQISTFDQSFDAPGSKLSSAAQIKEMRHFWKSVRRFFWKLEQNMFTNRRSTDCFRGTSTAKKNQILNRLPKLVKNKVPTESERSLGTALTNLLRPNSSKGLYHFS